MEHELIDQRITFTLDLEDHRPVREGAERYPAITRTVLEFLADAVGARHVLRHR